MAQTKQQRIEQLELYLKNSQEEVARTNMIAQKNHTHYIKRLVKERETRSALKAALGDIINRIDKTILVRRSTDTERAIKGVAKQALEKALKND